MTTLPRHADLSESLAAYAESFDSTDALLRRRIMLPFLFANRIAHRDLICDLAWVRSRTRRRRTREAIADLMDRLTRVRGCATQDTENPPA